MGRRAQGGSFSRSRARRLPHSVSSRNKPPLPPLSSHPSSTHPPTRPPTPPPPLSHAEPCQSFCTAPSSSKQWRGGQPTRWTTLSGKKLGTKRGEGHAARRGTHMNRHAVDRDDAWVCAAVEHRHLPPERLQVHPQLQLLHLQASDQAIKLSINRSRSTNDGVGCLVDKPTIPGRAEGRRCLRAGRVEGRGGQAVSTRQAVLGTSVDVATAAAAAANSANSSIDEEVAAEAWGHSTGQAGTSTNPAHPPSCNSAAGAAALMCACPPMHPPTHLDSAVQFPQFGQEHHSVGTLPQQHRRAIRLCDYLPTRRCRGGAAAAAACVCAACAGQDGGRGAQLRLDVRA